MRDQLEDAHKHMDDGYGRAQHLNRVELPKRFYKDVDVARGEDGFSVTLDGRQVRTPGHKIPVVVPALEIAQTMAGEWAPVDASANSNCTSRARTSLPLTR